LCAKQYRASFFASEYPSKHACAGVNKLLMSSVKNIDYNYDLELEKRGLKMGLLGNVIHAGDYNFKKYQHKIKNPVLPLELNLTHDK
jgi:hypothetical protein